MTPLQSVLVAHLRSAGRPQTIPETVAATGRRRSSVYVALTALVDAKLVRIAGTVPKGRGKPSPLYALAEAEAPSSEESVAGVPAWAAGVCR